MAAGLRATRRAAAVFLSLVGLFVATFSPGQHDRDVLFWASAAVVLVAAVAAALAADRTGRLEVAAVVTATLVGLLLLGWEPAGPSSAAELTGEGLLRAGSGRCCRPRATSSTAAGAGWSPE